MTTDKGVGLRGWLAGPGRKELGKPLATAVPLDKHRLAVLPLSNISKDLQDEYFADGLTEELISTASAISGLTVIARTSIMRYKGGAKGAGEIGRELNAGSLLEGSVRKSGSKLRVNVQLIDAQTEGHLWSQSFDREMQDIFAVQSEIAGHVANSLALKLTDREKRMIEARKTASVEAYNFYLKGRFYWNKRTKDGLEKAITYFEKAIAEDPDYALASVGLSDACGTLAFYGYSPRSETVPRGKDNANKALKLDDSLAEAHASLAVLLWCSWDYEGAGRELRAAIQLNPSYAYAHQLHGDYLSQIERDPKGGLVEYLRARELDPFSPITNLNVGAAYYSMREYGKAVDEMRKALELFPDFWNLHLYLSLALAMDGRFEESLAQVEETGRSSDKIWLIQGRGTTYGLWGKKDEALKALEDLRALSAKEYISPTMFAPVFAAIGDRDGAFECLEKAYAEKAPDLPGEIISHPFYADKLGTDPRWTKLLEQLELKQWIPKKG